MREEIEYMIMHEETAETEIYYHSLGEDIRGYLSGKKVKDILALDQEIKPCTCGGRAELHEYEGMGDGDYDIICKECGRTMSRSPYDVDLHTWDEVLPACIRDWNAGKSADDIKAMNEAEHERVTITTDDLTWKELHPNNMLGNSLEGYYSLVFRKREDGIYCCKWTIFFQKEEIAPMGTAEDSPIEAYILFMERIFKVTGPMAYPELTKESLRDWDSEDTFVSCGVNSYGDFIRSYKTLEEAKIGAAARCGWQGLNRDTMLKEEEYRGKTAEEVMAEEQ
ncbi:MAG: Lar family restriction alleviation protein [Lachnospiraceae bacterium]|nr:Lar family restriction alleviation protein [Lachnospiraceae bacterium]